MISGESPAFQVKFPVLKAPDGMPHNSQRSEIFGGVGAKKSPAVGVRVERPPWDEAQG
jgi:hypothetical protein